MDASANMMLFFKKNLTKAARKGDPSRINIRSNEGCVQLKILVLYAAYLDEVGICRLREKIEVDNEGVEVPVAAKRHREKSGTKTTNSR